MIQDSDDHFEDISSVFESAVADAERHIEAVESGNVIVRVAPSRKGAAALILLAVLATVTMYLVARPIPPRSPAEVGQELRWAVAAAAQEIEAFRVRNGRMPTAVEIFGVLNESVAYDVDGDTYFVTGRAGDVVVEFNNSMDLEEWLSTSSPEARED